MKAHSLIEGPGQKRRWKDGGLRGQAKDSPLLKVQIEDIVERWRAESPNKRLSVNRRRGISGVYFVGEWKVQYVVSQAGVI